MNAGKSSSHAYRCMTVLLLAAASAISCSARAQYDSYPERPVRVVVPYGQVHGTFANSVSALPHVRSGRLRAIAVTSAKRSEVFPELPSVSESGVPGYEITAWHAWLAPAGTPSAIVTRVSSELAKAVRAPDISSRLEPEGGKPIGSSPEEFRRHLSGELAKFSKVIKAGGIRIE
ncbi:MAG: tripartite tricarboxylate transporter substrate-binding protein [Burkholderiales bacterium]